MTRDEIMAMQPGNELDELVAVEVMGFERSRLQDGWIRIGSLATYPKRYSKDVAAAWLVVEKLQEKRIYLDIISFIGKYRVEAAQWTGESFHGNYALVVTSETVMEAICKVALLAVLEESK